MVVSGDWAWTLSCYPKVSPPLREFIERIKFVYV